jgi:DNA adenine methylase
MSDGLRAPFPWFGGKSRVADIVWDRFGDVANYVEPFFGSGAVLLARPHPPRIETVNDLHGTTTGTLGETRLRATT